MAELFNVSLDYLINGEDEVKEQETVVKYRNSRLLTGVHQVIMIPDIINLLSRNPDSCVMVAGGKGNLVNTIIAALIAMLSSAALTYFFGFDKDEPSTK